MADNSIQNVLNQVGTLAFPGIYDTLSAKIAEQVGFPMAFISGYSLAAATIGEPDFGLLTQTEVVERARAICNSVSIPIIVDADTHAWLVAHPGAELHVDVEASRLQLPDGRAVEYPIDAFARYCLTQGIDQLGYLLQQSDATATFEETRPWKP